VIAVRPSSSPNRIFVALDLPDELRRYATQLAEPLTDERGVRPVEERNLHITLQFLGDVQPRALDQVRASLEREVDGPPVRVRPGAVVPRPSADRARLLALELHDVDGALTALARRIHTMTGAILGGPVSNRPLWPHITLARFSRPERVRRSPTSQSERVFDITRLALYHSHIAPGHTPRYEELLGITLGTHAQRSPTNG
jgi:RNA 2',3'-cyclic 3'-phosphodiesterase